MLIAKLIDRNTAENIIGMKAESLEQLKEKMVAHFFKPENILVMVEGMNPFLFTDFDHILNEKQNVKTLAVVISKNPTGDVYVIGAEDIEKFTAHSYVLGGYAETEEEAYILAESFC